MAQLAPPFSLASSSVTASTRSSPPAAGAAAAASGRPAVCADLRPRGAVEALHRRQTLRCRSMPRDKLGKLLSNNRQWSSDRIAADPDYFKRLQQQQSPEYLWIGCADSRVPANVILGLDSGEVFVQRNVGNQATHTDLNVMSCLEYAVTELKVKTIICCGHYGCGAVKAALRMPSKTQGLVNCWISDIRECRNQHQAELKTLDPEKQVDRLCELNVMRQTFHVCTSPVVQNAWDQDQELAVYGAVYSLKDGLLRKLVGPLGRENACFDVLEYENSLSLAEGLLPTQLSYTSSYSEDASDDMINTAELASKVAQHIGWAERPLQDSQAAGAPEQRGKDA